MRAERLRLRFYLCVMVGICALGTVGFMAAEGLSPADALYFSLVTMSTVGYGDIHPSSPVGKLLSVVLIVTGVGTFLGVVANATEIMLSRRERKSRERRLRTLIGLFFSDLGTPLLRLCASCDAGIEDLRPHLGLSMSWKPGDFTRAAARLREHRARPDRGNLPLAAVHRLLSERSELLLRLLENPATEERGEFGETLRAAAHLREELACRPDLAELPDSDLGHLAGDLTRVYKLLASQWVEHARHLRTAFPFMFSLAARRNPFAVREDPRVRQEADEPSAPDPDPLSGTDGGSSPGS